MNPEFRRQLWLQFSVTRLIVMPLLLALVFLAVSAGADSPNPQALAVASGVLFGLLVWGMGTFAAGASVVDELNDRTWDQQRMSAMRPWAMTWGKLLGASSYAWYGGLLCLLVAVPAALMGPRPELVLWQTTGAILLGVLLQAMLMAVNLQLSKASARMARRGALWVVLLLVLWVFGPLLEVLSGAQVTWWQHEFNRPQFAVVSLAVFVACALCAAWRSMAELLAVRQLPWAWPSLALLATVYLSGFVDDGRGASFSVIGLLTCVILTYASLLTEPQTRPHWQRIVARLSSAQWRAALQQLPRWSSSLALALPFAVWVSVSLTGPTPFDWTLGKLSSLQPITLVLLLARDCALALFFAFSPNARRPILGLIVLLLVLDGLLPWLLTRMNQTFLLDIVQPLLASGAESPLLAGLHLVVALGLLAWRWRRTASSQFEPQGRAPETGL